MIGSRPERFAIDHSRLQNLGSIDRHGIHEIGGPLLVGGVNWLNARTGLFSGVELRNILTDDQRFQAYFEFREQALEIAVTELMSEVRSPADLFLLIATDIDIFNSGLVEYIVLRSRRHDGTFSILQHCSIDEYGYNGTEVDNLRIMKYFPKDLIRQIEDYKKMLCRELSSVQRYFAYRKYLVKLDFIQSNSDPGDVVQRLKSSNRCPTLQDHELRHCLKSHIDILKEYEERKRDPAFSISEYERFASEKINSELSSRIQKHIDHDDWMLMEQYYDRMKLRGLAKRCATHAQLTGFILVGEALPIREHLKEHMLSTNAEVKKLSLIRRAAQQSLQVYKSRIQEKFRSRAPLGIREHLKERMLSANAEVTSSFKQAAQQSLQVYRSRVQEKFRSKAPLGMSLRLLFLGTVGFCTWRQTTN